MTGFYSKRNTGLKWIDEKLICQGLMMSPAAEDENPMELLLKSAPSVQI